MPETTSDKTYEDLFGLIMTRSNAKIRTMFPAEVLSFNADKATATVRPVVHSFFFNTETGEPEPYLPQPIPNCPVSYQAGGGYEMVYPLGVGDQVYIGVAERSIDEWANSGQTRVVPRDLRRFDLSDAVVLAGIVAPGAREDSIPTDGTELRHAASGFKVRVTENGLYFGDGTNELIALVRDLLGQVDKIRTQLNALSTGVVPSGGGALSTATPVTAATATGGPIALALASVDSDLDSIQE